MTLSYITGTVNDDVINTNSKKGEEVFVYANRGNDIINGGEGIDEVITDGLSVDPALATKEFHEKNTDKVYTQGGNDRVDSFYGNDIIDTGDGNDTVYAQDNYAGVTINTGSGNDTVSAGYGADNISTGDGSDHINNYRATRSGSDVIDAGKGDDFVSAMGAKVTLGDGSDTFIVGHTVIDWDQWVGKETYITDFKVGVDRIDFTMDNSIIKMTSSADGKFTYMDVTAGIGGATRITFDATDVPVTTTMDQLAFHQQKLVIIGTEGDDNIVGGIGDDTIYGGEGRNSLFGSFGNDKIYGGKDFDYIEGGEGNDQIFGGTGNDTIIAGAGNDRVSAFGGDVKLGDGADRFLVGNGNWSDWVGKTTYISDFKLGVDKIDGVIGGLDAVTYASQDGKYTILEIVSDQGGSTKIKFDIEDVPVNTALQKIMIQGLVISGTGGDDVLNGGVRDDIIHGNGGNDKIYGGAGDDQLSGDDGNDEIYDSVGNNGANGGRGDDIINVTNGYVTLGAGDDTFLVGGDAATWANWVGKQTYITDFKLGEDRLDSKMNGLSATIRASADGKYTIVDVTAAIGGTTSIYLETSDVPATTTLDQLLKKGDNIRGTNGHDTLTGTNLDDQIYGEGGNDIIHGGAGNDYLLGGDGNDQIFGDNGRDTVDAGRGDDLVNAVGADVTLGEGNDTFLVGDPDNWQNWAGKQTYLTDFKLGVDKLDSRMEGLDASLRSSADGKYTILDITAKSGGTTSLYFNAHDVPVTTNLDAFLGHKEGIIVSGSEGNDTIFGTKDDDTIYGNGGNDNLYGKEGNDKLYGGAGNDILRGHEGNDNFVGNDGNDVLVGGTGDDALNGNDGNDRIYGEADNDIINGGAGDDRLYGGAGNDTIHAGSGKDVIIGGDGDDVIMAVFDAYLNQGSDISKIDDTIDAGAGNDIVSAAGAKITLGEGKDTVVVDSWDNWNHTLTYVTDMTRDQDELSIQLAIDDFIINTTGKFTDLTIKDTVGGHEATLRFETSDVGDISNVTLNDLLSHQNNNNVG